MGTSMDAILFFGITAEDVVFFRDIAHIFLNNDIIEECLDNNELESKIMDSLPDYLYLDFHCSDSYPIPFIFVKDFYIRAYSGYPEKISSDLCLPNEYAIDYLDELAEKLNWMPPKWYLVSYWG